MSGQDTTIPQILFLMVDGHLLVSGATNKINLFNQLLQYTTHSMHVVFTQTPGSWLNCLVSLLSNRRHHELQCPASTENSLVTPETLETFVSATWQQFRSEVAYHTEHSSTENIQRPKCTDRSSTSHKRIRIPLVVLSREGTVGLEVQLGSLLSLILLPTIHSFFGANHKQLG